MKIYNLPFDLDQEAGDRNENVTIRAYVSDQNTNKNKIVLHQNMINLIVSGTKTILYAEDTTTIQAGELVILSKGNCLTSEILPNEKPFSSILIYFSNAVMSNFLIKYKSVTGKEKNGSVQKPFLAFQQDPVIKNYVSSLDLMLKMQAFSSPELRQLKLEELLLYLLKRHPEKLLSLKIESEDNEEIKIRQAVESNFDKAISVEELAFICHCSLSTFKRRFARIYNAPPQKWLLERKMKLAAELLSQKDEKPGLVYQKIGYENHSSFSKSFKQFHQITPSEFQLRILNG